MPQLLMCSFHHHSILVFSLDFSDLHIFPVCVFVSVSGFRGVFGSLGFCCCPCLFACCRSRFKGLTESLWGFPGYRNQFLLINSQAHLLFIWAWTHYTLRVIQAAALLVKGGFESDGPTERACRWDSGLTQEASPGQLMSEVAPARREFCSNHLTGSKLPHHAQLLSCPCRVRDLSR